MHPLPCSFALLLLLLFADAHSENLIEQAILPVDQPFDNNNTLTTSDITIETEIIAATYTYLMKLRVKTSDDNDADYIETYAIPDTGSDLIVLNVKDCCGDACHCCTCETTCLIKMAYQKKKTCIEMPKTLIPCYDDNCDALARLNIKKKCSFSGPQKGSCEYDATYADGFTTHGMLGKGKFSFSQIIDKGDKGDKVFEDNFKFGASTISEGRLQPKSQGIVGLGRGSLSLLMQISRIERKFSYCLPIPNPESSPNSESKIKFGNKVATSDKFTRLQKGGVCDFRYCVHLATISVGDREEDKITVSEENKVMVIDSGSSFTSLANREFDKFFEKVKNVIGREHEPKPVKPYDNCFNESADSAKKLEKLVSFDFKAVGGSGTPKIELKRENFFDRHTSDEGNKYLCLTVVDGDKKKNNHGRLPPHEEDFGRENENPEPEPPHHILGNRAQMDFLVAFDLKDMKVSFMKSCGEKENLEPVLSE